MAFTTKKSSRGISSDSAKPEKKSSRAIIACWVLAVFVAALAGFLIYWLAFPSKGDVLAAGYTGTPEQDKLIQDKLTESFSLEKDMMERLAAWHELRPVLVKMPAKKRQPIMVNSILQFTEKTLLDLSALPPEKKKERIEIICKDAENTYAFYRRMPVSKQEKVKDVMRTPEGQAMVKRVNNALMATLSPEDRTAIGPAIQIWHKMLSD